MDAVVQELHEQYMDALQVRSLNPIGFHPMFVYILKK